MRALSSHNRFARATKGESMSTIETENGTGVQHYEPFTPFQESYAFVTEASTTSLLERAESSPVVTPFVSEYAGVESQSPQAGELRDLLFELYDTEFDELLDEIAHEAWEAVTQRAEPFGETGATETAEQFLGQWLEPVRRHAEATLDNIAEAVSEHDVASMSEAEFDTFFERFEPHDTELEPYFENFLGKLVKKAKTLAKKAISVAQKGLTLVPGIGGLISKLKALVRPLLDRVLKTAIDKLPPTLRPMARQLAQRVLGAAAGEVEEAEALTAAPAAPDVSAIQQQFDLQAATLMFAADATEQELVLTEALYEADRADGAPVAELHEARTRFVDDLEAGVDPQQALEQFIPAVMAVLPIARTVIGVIGRNRVVTTLAGFLASFIKQYVPPESATQLSRAIVDAGLRMLSLETPADPDGPRLANETIAQAVEDTVRRVAELDEAVFQEPALLEAALTEAFHEAAAENFPQEVIVPELHEASVRATWVPMPVGKRRKYYKKYTHVFDVEITPQIADAVRTFGGAKLAAVLKDQLGVAPPVRAKVHVYQAIHGTTLGRIARFERSVPGLGSAAKRASVQLHPLTVEAAAALLQQPKLGRNVPGEFRSTRGRIAVGARFYYLEIAGARPIPAAADGSAGAAAVRRTSEVNVTLDFPKDEFRVFVYLSEPEAQEIAGRVRKQDLTSVLVLAKRVYEAGVNVALGGDIHRHVKILTETLPQEEFLGKQLKKLAEGLKQQLAKKVVGWVGKGIAGYVQASAGEFVAAADDPADGVTVVIRIANPPGAPLVRKALRGEGLGLDVLRDLGALFKGDPKLAVQTVSGFRAD
jgi:hypothetical protein